MPYTPIVGSLAYVLDRQTNRVLMVRRNARPDDEHFGKLNGLGGKLEGDENVAANVRRELREEADIELTSVKLRGTVSWPGFGANGEDWLGFIYLVDGWTGTPPDSNPEGVLEWIDRSRLLAACSDDEATRREADIPMWEGDRYFIPLVFDSDERAFHGVMPYENGRPISWEVERL